MIVTSTTKRREMIHWLWLWTLAGIAISVLCGRSLAQEDLPSLPPPDSTTRAIPMPNVDHPDLFRYPDELRNSGEVSLDAVLRYNRTWEHRHAVITWRQLNVMPHSETWRQVGLGVAYLRLEKTDQAIRCLQTAIELAPNNAVAEYFLGRAHQQQGRDVPFWYERNPNSPFRLASHRTDRQLETTSPLDRSFLPHFRNDTFDLDAREHFRRAVQLAPKCDLNATIDVTPTSEPRIRLTGLGTSPTSSITVRHLLISLHEVDFLDKAQREIGERIADPPATTIMSTSIANR